jgi:hypothetical protein
MLRVRVKSVTIRPDVGSSGMTKLDSRYSNNDKQVLITLAGPYAQRCFAPHSRWRSSSTSGITLNSGWDFDTVTALIYDEHGNGDAAKFYRRYAEAKAKQLVDGWWRHIETAAEALLERETLTGAELSRVILTDIRNR